MEKSSCRIRKIRVKDEKMRKFMKSWNSSMTLKRRHFTANSARQSDNEFIPTDMSTIIEPIAKEIERLPRVRSSPFDCFRPNELQHKDNLRTMIPMKDLIRTLKFYKNEKVDVVLKIWSEDKDRDRANVEQPVEEIKVEPEEIENLSSTMNTINIDVSERGDAERVESEREQEFGEDDDDFLNRYSHSHNQLYSDFQPVPSVDEDAATEAGQISFAEDTFITSLSELKREGMSQDLFADEHDQKHEFGGQPGHHPEFIFESSQDVFPDLPSSSSTQDQNFSLGPGPSQEEFMFEDSQDLFAEMSQPSSQSLQQSSQRPRSSSQSKIKLKKSGFL